MENVSATASKEAEIENQTELNPFYKPANTVGSKGVPVNMICNYIRLNMDPDKGVYMYEVHFHPNVDCNQIRMKYLNEHRDKIGGTKTFDGVTLYLPVLLKEKLTTFVSKGIDGNDVEVRILFKRKEAMGKCLHLYNVLFHRVMNALKLVQFDRKFFDPTAPKIIPQAKLEVWPGYVTAVDEYDGGIMLCCDVSHRLLCQKTVLELLIEIYRSNPSQFQENAKKTLLGSVVITKYNNQTYRIDDICFDKNPLSEFPTKTGNVSFYNYYRTNYNLEINDQKQPLLINIKKLRGTDKNKAEDMLICLVPELCYLTGLRDDMRKDLKLMREIATFTRVTPNQRIDALNKFIRNVKNSKEASAILSSWGLTLNSGCEVVQGRQMDEEKIQFAKKTFGATSMANFSKYAGNNELLEVVHLHDWIVFHVKNNIGIAKTFCELMQSNASAMGVEVKRPKIVQLENDRVDTYVNSLRANIKKETQCVVCICPTSRDDRYNAIKKLCCAEVPIPSQVINANTLFNDKKSRSVVQKIALQINCKLGGSLWSVKIPFKNVMICGIDSYHDPTQKSNSVAAFVSSLNQGYTKWYSKCVIQSKKEEIVNGLCSCFIASLIAYETENGKLPDNVFIYRDGVGDSQLQLCSDYEIPQLQAACLKAFPNYTPKLTYIVVQKRINTRYFGTDQKNPSPGTIIDNTVTRANLYDFFLVPQSVREGTVSPCHYIVLKDDSLYAPDIVQRLSYKLCFLYYNWPGTIRVPACCQYAHKMAYLVGQCIKRTPAEQLSKKLFYL